MSINIHIFKKQGDNLISEYRVWEAADKEKIISEDDNKIFEKNIQKITDNNIENIEKILSEKEKEISQI